MFVQDKIFQVSENILQLLLFKFDKSGKYEMVQIWIELYFSLSILWYSGDRVLQKVRSLNSKLDSFQYGALDWN